MRYAVSPLLFLFLAAGGAQSAEVPADAVATQLAKLHLAEGEEYLAARAALLELPREAVLPVLLAKKARAAWSDKSWREEVLVDAMIAWIENPDSARKVYALEGIDPAKYRLRRRPEPEVGRELKSMKGAAPVLFEVLLKTLGNYPFVSTDPADRAKERAALEVGVIGAIAGSRHPAAAHLLKAKLEDDREPIAVRRTAAIGVGQAGGSRAFVTLSAVAQDRAAPEVLRGGAIAGLGQVRSPASAEVLARLATGREGAEIRGPAIAALGTLGNVWVLRRSRAPSGEALREKVSRALVEVLAAEDGARFETQVEEAMVMVAHPVLRAELSRMATLSADTDKEVRARAERALARLALAARHDS